MNIEWQKKSPISQRKNSEFEPQRILVGVTGGSAAGKTTLCETIKREIQYDSDVDMTILSCDSFYKGVDKTKVDIAQYNFDHPDALDWDYAYDAIYTLLQGMPAKIPIYCFVTHSRLEQYEVVLPAQVIVFEGILSLYEERIRDLMSYKIFIHCDDDIRLCRRLVRDVKERGRTVENVLYQYSKFVKRAFETFIRPFMNQADLIIPGHRSNHVSVAFIVNNLKNMAKQNGLLREKLNTLLYFGDVLYSIDGFIRNRTKIDFRNPNSVFKQLFFPDESLQQDLQFVTKSFIINKVTTAKQLYKVIKQCFKYSLYTLEKSLQQDKFSFTDLECYNFQEIQKQEFQPKEGCKYILIALPFLFKKDMKLLRIIEEKIRSQFSLQLIVVNVFTEMKVVTEINWSIKKLKIFVNAYLVGKYDKFKSLLLLQGEQEPDFNYMQDKLFNKMERFVTKRKKN